MINALRLADVIENILILFSNTKTKLVSQTYNEAAVMSAE